MASKKEPHDTIIALTKLTKTYGSGENVVHALREVTVGFGAGSFTAIMGPSGSGKSTLLQCAAGLDRPTDGTVRIADRHINGLSETELTKLRREHIGFVFQAFNLLQTLTAAQNVALPLRLAGKKVPTSVIADALAQVGLAERAGHLPGQLSGGQQQRVAIARALVTQPAVLFADEPTGALDTNAGRDILKRIRNIVDTKGQTVIMVTHDPVAASYADRVVFLADGAVVDSLESPTPQDVARKMTQLER
jgi:putative ABC transport system ATP-binding protein